MDCRRVKCSCPGGRKINETSHTAVSPTVQCISQQPKPTKFWRSSSAIASPRASRLLYKIQVFLFFVSFCLSLHACEILHYQTPHRNFNSNKLSADLIIIISVKRLALKSSFKIRHIHFKNFLINNRKYPHTHIWTKDQLLFAV